MIQSFIASSTPPGIIQHVGTRESVQDFESIREALGYDKIHFIGCSTYVKFFLGLSDHTEVHWDSGSYRIAHYASKYPQHVGRFVLDAISPHGMVRTLPYLIPPNKHSQTIQSILNQSLYDIVAANRALLRADAYCQNNASCPFHNQGKGSIPQVSWKSSVT